MEFFTNFSLSGALHEFGQVMKVPCTIVLMVLIVVAVWQIGDVLMELLTERRGRERDVEGLLDRLHEGGAQRLEAELDASRLPKSQKRMLKKLAAAHSLPQNERTALAQKFLEDEEGRLERKTAVPDLLAKLGPMFGLLGTLIPLGPGIVALGQGDTATLSAAIGLAFDTTIAGLLSAAVGSVISNVRTRWYDGCMSAFETVMEYVLEEVKS